MKKFEVTFYAPDESGELKPFLKLEETGEFAKEAARKIRSKFSKQYPDLQRNLWMAIG